MAEPAVDAERAALLKSLQAQRDHVLGIIESLDEAALRTPVLPSGWTPIGMVNHLATEVEAFWFRAVVAGEPDAIARVADSGDMWAVGPDVAAHEVVELYRRETAHASEVITATTPDAAPAWWPQELFGSWRMNDLRQIVLHVIAETACHAGHLDAARELLDGRQWLVLT